MARNKALNWVVNVPSILSKVTFENYRPLLFVVYAHSLSEAVELTGKLPPDLGNDGVVPGVQADQAPELPHHLLEPLLALLLHLTAQQLHTARAYR